uniref:Uncharacterized protein n=1 Tax=Lutzomyia longipalpis TaxID=7200 RepID=A0A7G3AKS2_LUTLO
MIETLSMLRHHVPAVVVTLTLSDNFVINGKLECLLLPARWLRWRLCGGGCLGGSARDGNGGKGCGFSENFIRCCIIHTMILLLFNSYFLFFSLCVLLLQNSYLDCLALRLGALHTHPTLPLLLPRSGCTLGSSCCCCRASRLLHHSWWIEGEIWGLNLRIWNV